MSPFPSARDSSDLERGLRAGAPGFGPPPPPALRGRILAALRATPRPSESPRSPDAERFGPWIAAAAAALVLCSAWWLTGRMERTEEGRGAPGGARSSAVAAVSRGLLDAGSRVLSLPRAAEGNLRLEAERLLADTTRVAEGVVRGLPGPLRARLERL
jgi:ferric-dicitrate binding protein FerR (iron transport regulator)